jgi:hypothetical protein
MAGDEVAEEQGGIVAPVSSAGPDSASEPVPSIAERIERERQRIMRGNAIVFVCSAATASMYKDHDPEMMREELVAASVYFNEAMQEIERISKAAEGVQ